MDLGVGPEGPLSCDVAGGRRSHLERRVANPQDLPVPAPGGRVCDRAAAGNAVLVRVLPALDGEIAASAGKSRVVHSVGELEVCERRRGRGREEHDKRNDNL